MTLTLLLHMSYLLSWEHLSCLWMKSNYPQYNNFDSIQITCVCGVVWVYVWRLYSYDDMIYVCYYYIVLDVLHAHSIHSNLLLLCCYCWDPKYNVYHKFKTLSTSGIETRYKCSYLLHTSTVSSTMYLGIQPSCWSILESWKWNCTFLKLS